MKYVCCIWFCFVWFVCSVEYGVYGLHVQQAPEIIQRITRQATRYGSGGSVSGPNYRPVPGGNSNFNVRNIASDLTTSLSSSSQLNAVSGNSVQRPAGVGAYTFGGMASGRPTNGNSFAVNNALKNVGVRNSQSGVGQTIVGSGSVNAGSSGRPQQLQHALMQAAQYQLQHQQLRRQMPQQQLYRQRPTNNYQQQQQQQYN